MRLVNKARGVKRIWFDSYLDLALWSLPELAKAAAIPNRLYLWRLKPYTPRRKIVGRVVTALNRRYKEMGMGVIITADDLLEPASDDTRLEEMKIMENAGNSREEIGKHFDISRERVRQILGNFNPKGMKICQCCGKAFPPKRATSKYCRPGCKYDYRVYGRPRPTYIEACIDRITKKLSPPDRNGCWMWNGRKGRASGYGYAQWYGKNQTAHRVMWRLVYGDIPDGMFVCHSCDVPSCCNPHHLFLGTAASNAKDRDAKGRHQTRVLNDSQVATIKAFYKSTADLQWLARSFNVHPTTIYQVVRGVTHSEEIKERRKKTAGRYNAKLALNQVYRIRDLYLHGNHSHRSLALMYHVSSAAIERIVTGKTWKHI